jgi:argininosuccinate synthase
MEKISEYTSGTVRMILYKGNVIIAGRKSPYSLYLQDLASFGASSYDHGDAAGFINLFGLATGVAAIVHRGIDKDTGQTPEIKGMAGFHEK